MRGLGTMVAARRDGSLDWQGVGNSGMVRRTWVWDALGKTNGAH